MPDVRLNRYQVMETIGQGSQGQTYRGIDRVDGSDVAIKVLSLRQLQDWKGFDLFERECKVLARLNHPGIPRFVDNYASEESGDYFLVMGLAPGRSLRTRQEQGERFSPKKLRKLLGQALDILDYLHGQSPAVIHRDIKPSNFVLADDGHLTLVDFGGVRAAFRPEGGSTMIGTFGFMAPEQLHGDATAATDIFALGATMVSLITGTDPEDLPRKGLAIDLESVIPRHPLRLVLEQMLAPDPSERLADAAAVRAVLNQSARKAKAEAKARAKQRPKPARSAGGQSLVKRHGQVPAEIPSEIRELATTESSIGRVFLWLFASLASGALVLMEAVFLPLIFRLSAAWQRDPEDKAVLEQEQEQNLRAIKESRATLRYLADQTNPVDGRRGQD